MTGIHNSRGTFSLTGSTTEQSTLTINGGLAGVVAKNKTTIKDSSLHVNLSWDKAPQDKWGTPIQNNGLMALGAIGNDLSLLNTASEGKSLTITTKNVDVVGQKTSGLLSLMQGNLSIENFAAINPKISDFGAVDDEGKRSISLWHKQTPGIPGVDSHLERLYNILQS